MAVSVLYATDTYLVDASSRKEIILYYNVYTYNSSSFKYTCIVYTCAIDLPGIICLYNNYSTLSQIDILKQVSLTNEIIMLRVTPNRG